MSPLTRFHYKSLLKQQKIKFVSRFTIAICLIRTLLIICLEAQIWAKWAKIGPKIRFFCHFFKFGSLVFWRYCRMIARSIVYLLVEVKPMKKNLMGTKLGPKVGVFPFSEGCIVSFPWYWTRL